MMALQVKNLSKEYAGRPVLDGVSFYLAGGERVGLVGVNGCGKSTLMKILAGEIEAGGGSVSWVTPGLTKGYLSQQERDLPAELSGGEKTRAALAAVLASKPDVLLLDEPTNHLDVEGLQCLESLLKSYRGAVLVVSHDRYFLDEVATRILELENGRLKEYPGNYSAYARQKQMELERAREEYRQYVQVKKHLEAAIQRQMAWAQSNETRKLTGELKVKKAEYKGQAKRHMQTAQALEARLERSKKEKPRDAARINLRMDGAGSVARNLILAEQLGFTYDGARWIFRDASFYVQRGEKVAITGPNGAGKSTLVKLILGDLAPSAGRLYRSPLRVAYLAQEMEHLDPAHTVLQAATGDTAMDQAYARSLLGCLLFSRDDVLKPVAVLSGGEKVRLALAKLLLAAPDLLVLDEPTNGLDLPSRERVEEALISYPGTLLLVSHDRYLLQRVPTKELRVAAGRVETVTAMAAPVDDRAERRLLLETRLAQLSAALAAPKPEEKARLDQEFIEISRELRSLR